VNREARFGVEQDLVIEMAAPAKSSRGTLCAVLATPPTTSGVRTVNALNLAKNLLGFDRLAVVNLLDVPSRDMRAMAAAGVDHDAWARSRARLESALVEADALLAGWGVRPLTGHAEWYRTEQLAWLRCRARHHGHSEVWAIGAQPRHPSRWHQYVSDRHGRTGEGTTAERLRTVLVRVDLEVLCPPRRSTPARPGAGAPAGPPDVEEADGSVGSVSQAEGRRVVAG